jgi:FkbM family methyltransferase
MRESVKRVVRTAQTFAPWLADMKADVQHRLCTITRRPFEADFAALRLFGGRDRLHLDIGANRGQSITAITITAADPRIHSFEANPVLAARLSERFGASPRVRIEPLGLSDEAGEFELFIPVYRGYMFDGLASLDREAAMSWLNRETILGFDPARLRAEVTRCRVTTLDSMETAPFFMKLDIGGNELKALKGGRRTLGAHRPVLLVETPGQELIDFLAEFRYALYRYDPRRGFVAGDRSGLNSFFMTHDKAELVSRHIVT